jgi:hypothetical protein
MSHHSRAKWILLAVMIAAFLLSGCAGPVKNMQTFQGDEATIVPEPGKAMIVFMRPSGVGFAIQSSVFRVAEPTPDLAGILAAKMKVAYQVEPGEHLFMVIGESADFMSAEVEAGKTYYVRVAPRMGVWKARFSLMPVAQPNQNGDELDGWLKACEWVQETSASDTWAASNMKSIQDKQNKYYEKWMEKDAAGRARLTLEDGVL